MNTRSSDVKRKKRGWIWMLLISMFVPLLPTQQAMVEVAGV
ncbi:hypothetical protein [Paenibacillus lycopersici]|nr:hypothetical protein [Paenibacillus lycopersici]